MGAISLFKEEVSIDLRSLQRHKKWLTRIAERHGFSIKDLNYIFCSDEYLYQLNVEYLEHDTLTDIITFDMRDDIHKEETLIQGDVFISLDRVKENAKTHHTAFDKELARVMAHGLLHLIGFKDKTADDQQKMRKQEEIAISLFSY